MKQLIIIFIFLGCCMTSYSQTGKLTGSVMDAITKTPLELATISIFAHDSSLITYRLSDKNGNFSVDKLPLRKSIWVSVTYTGYIGYNKTLQLEAGIKDSLAILLALKNDTNAIVISTTIPIRMNGDTLEINPAAFKMKENAVVEELLNQVSGITIWSDGSITVNGKKVQSLLVDGKPFLESSDSRVATQNLPKSAIERIQLYQEYDRSNIGLENKPQDSLLTMNIKLKENAKKGYFGKASAGYGSSERFESDLSFQVYNKKSSAGIGGGFNNINKNLGNLQEMFQNNTYRNYNPNLYSVGRFGTNGINKNYSVGGLYTHNFIETSNSRQNNRITLNYNKSGVDSYISDINLQNRIAINNPQFIREEGVQNNWQDRHDFGINYIKTNSYNDNLNVNGSANNLTERSSSSRTTEVRDSVNLLQSTNVTTSAQNRRSDNESLNLSFAKADNDAPAKSFSISLNGRRGNSRSERDTRSIFESFTDRSKSNSNNRHYDVSNQSLNMGGTFDYSGFKRLLLGRYNLFGINLNFTQTINYSRQTDDNRVSDYDSATKLYNANANISNYNKREVFQYTPALLLSKMFYKYNEARYRYINFQVKWLDDIKRDKNLSSFEKRTLDRSFQFPRYEGSMNYQYQKREKYNYNFYANYQETFDYPSIDQLYTIVDDINAYNTRIGNPLLRNRNNHLFNLNASFSTQNPKSVYAVNANVGANYNLAINPVADSIINDFSGKRISYYTNGDKSKNLGVNYGFNISRKFNRNNLQLMLNGQYTTGILPNYIDAVYNTSETTNLSNQYTLQYSVGTILVINLGQTLQDYKSRQTASQLKTFKNSSISTKMGIVVNYPANFSFSSTLDNVTNSNLNKPTLLWNAFTTYRFMKQQAELKFSAMDLLKQYQNITSSANTYGTTTRIANGLQQYFLLTLSYYPRKFGKTEIKARGN